MADKRLRKTFLFDGKRYYVEASTEKELWMKYTNKMRDLEENVIKASTITVEEWTWKAVNVYKAGMTYEVRKLYDTKLRHYVLQYIGDYRLKDVRPIQCQQVLNKITGYGVATINDVYQMIRFIFRTAYENHLIPLNPALSLVKPNGKPKQKRRAITDEEERALLKAVQCFDNGDMYLFMLFCGCRPKEARNLMHEDFSLNSKGQSLLHIRGTKTDNADRYVPCPPNLYEKYSSGSGFLFTTSGGKTYTDDYVKKVNNRLYREMDIALGAKLYRNQIIESKLAEDFSPYCLRHTFCTNLAKRGIDIRIAQKLMGHSDIQMTANIYTHIKTEEIDFSDFFPTNSPHISHTFIDKN